MQEPNDQKKESNVSDRSDANLNLQPTNKSQVQRASNSLNQVTKLLFNNLS